MPKPKFINYSHHLIPHHDSWVPASSMYERNEMACEAPLVRIIWWRINELDGIGRKRVTPFWRPSIIYDRDETLDILVNGKLEIRIKVSNRGWEYLQRSNFYQFHPASSPSHQLQSQCMFSWEYPCQRVWGCYSTVTDKMKTARWIEKATIMWDIDNQKWKITYEITINDKLKDILGHSSFCYRRRGFLHDDSETVNRLLRTKETLSLAFPA